MALKMNDKSIGITIPNAYIRIDYLVINPGLPIITRAPSTFADEEYTENEVQEDGSEKVVTKTRKIEQLGEIIKEEKGYNVNLHLQFWNEEKENVYHRKEVSINGLLEKELSLKNFYKKLKELEQFSEAEDI